MIVPVAGLYARMDGRFQRKFVTLSGSEMSLQIFWHNFWMPEEKLRK